MRPLEGITIIDLTQYQQGPFATAMLADMGAEVIKVEQRLTGDPGRNLGPWTRQGLSAYFETHNRGKKGITVDVRKPQGREIVYRLVKGADIFAQNFRFGVADRLGLGYETLSQINPRLIYLSGTGFGMQGQHRDRPGFDVVGQAMGGIISVAGPPNTPDIPLGASVGDQTGAFLLAQGALLALLHRERTGEGQHVDVSLVGSVIALMGWTMQAHLFTGVVPRKHRGRLMTNGFTGSFPDKDGRYFVVQVMAAKPREKFFRVLGLWDTITERYPTDDDVRAKSDELFQLIDQVTRTRSRDEWIKLLEEADVVTAPVLNCSEVAASPQVLANEYIAEVDHPVNGRTRVLGMPIKLSKTPGKIGIAPSLGQHTDEILQGLGYSDADIAQLREEEIV